MKRLILSIFASLILSLTALSAQEADAILGLWNAERGGEVSKVEVTKKADGTYMAKCIWLENMYDKKGNLRLDEKNPDKALRNTPCNQIVLIDGLKYNAEKNCWDGAKVYDPTLGVKANATLTVQADGRIKVKGTVAGISQSVYWTRNK